MDHFKHHEYYTTCPGLNFMILASSLHHILLSILILSPIFHWNSKRPLLTSCTEHILIYLNVINLFDFCSSVHHHTIKINQQTRCNTLSSLSLDVHMWLNMFQASTRPSSVAYNCTRSLRFYRWKEPAGALLIVVWPVITGQTTTNNTPASFHR